MGKLTLFQFTLDSTQAVYYPGQTVSGTVTMTLIEPMKMRSIKLKMKGESYCHWTERHSSGSGKNRKTVTKHYRAKEHIIKIDRILFGGQGESEIHPLGTFTYPFSFVLPSGIPSSFEGHYGYIRYILKCKIDKPWKFDHNLKHPIIVNDIIDTNDPKYAYTSGGEKHKEVGCLCCKAGPLEFSSSIDRACYCPGEAILISANVQNKTTRNMKAMNAKLVKTIEYHATRKTKISHMEVAELYGPSIPKGEDATWNNQPFGIPALPPTITNSKVIKVHYQVIVYVGVPWGIDPFIAMPITLGTVPFLGMYGQAVQYGTPEDQQGPPAGYIDNYVALPPPPPNVFGYPDMPPPSYSSVVGDEAVNIKKEKNSHTKGDLMYQPIYTFAQPYQGSLTPVGARPAEGVASFNPVLVELKGEEEED